MKIGGKEFAAENKTYVMGILNMTPDSFSDGGKYNRLDAALVHVEQMISEGMDILDVGGESIRPGYTMLPAEEEIERVVPVLEAVKREFDIPVSLDTYKSRVARAGIAAGADMINDIWGLRYDEKLAGVIAESGLPCCLMHNRREPEYTNFVSEVLADLEGSLQIAAQAGIPKERIVLDPGIGFGKLYEQNLQALNALQELHRLGCPVLLGVSRKSVIGLTLRLPVTQRLEGTLATTALAVLKGVNFVRVHDVKENVRVIRMLEAVLGSGAERR